MRSRKIHCGDVPTASQPAPCRSLLERGAQSPGLKHGDAAPRPRAVPALCSRRRCATNICGSADQMQLVRLWSPAAPAAYDAFRPQKLSTAGVRVNAQGKPLRKLTKSQKTLAATLPADWLVQSALRPATYRPPDGGRHQRPVTCNTFGPRVRSSRALQEFALRKFALLKFACRDQHRRRQPYDFVSMANRCRESKKR